MANVVPAISETIPPENDFVPLPKIGKKIFDYAKTYDFHGNFIDDFHRKLMEDSPTGSVDVGIKGSLWVNDALKLYELAYFATGDVLELGTGHGQSTFIIASALRNRGTPGKLVSVDSWDYATRMGTQALETRALLDIAEFYTEDGFAKTQSFIDDGRQFGFTFIDHSHTYDDVQKVCAILHNVITPGAFALFHDYNDRRNRNPEKTDYGVYQGVEEGLDKTRFRFFGLFGCTALYRKAA